MARRNYLAACLISTAILPAMAYADGPLPTDPTVVTGNITITSPSDVQLLLQQASQGAIIDWGSFSIGAGYGVDFQNGSGATLNRVTGGDLSSIMGSLTATGSVFLVNQNGVYVGKDGVVETGGRFVASTLDITNQDFLNGGDNVFAGDSQAYVINLGRISSLGGDVSLMARNVVNSGTVTAPNGTVGLVAGREILMRDASVADGMFAVRLGSSDSSVTEAGTIAAAAAELRTNGGNVYALAGNTQGTIAATGVAKVKGRVFLTAGDEGHVKVEKTVKATDADGTGGAIAVNGGTVYMAGTLDASGTEGGTVIINSAIDTVFTGTVLAFGDDVDHGGFVEVSGHHLSFGGTVETDGGTLLIDPANIEITGDNSTLRLTDASLISTSDLILALASNNVIIETSGDEGEAGTIAISQSVYYESEYNLTLLAHGDILAYDSIQNGLDTGGGFSSAAVGGEINLVAGWDGSTSTELFDPADFGGDLATQTVFGNSSGAGYSYDGNPFEASGTVFIGSGDQYYGVAVGSGGGTTRVYANDVLLQGSSYGESFFGSAQLGFNTGDYSAVVAAGDILVRSVGDITLAAGNDSGASVQIGHVGQSYYESPPVDASGAITIEALGDMTLAAGTSSDGAFAMVGHGAANTYYSVAGGTRRGDITVTLGGELSVASFPGGELYNAAWVGHQSGDFQAVSNANILITAAALDDSADTEVGSGDLGLFDGYMFFDDLEGGNVTVILTDSGVQLVGETGGGSCECSDHTPNNLIVQVANDIVLGPNFFFSNLGGGSVALATDENFHNKSGGLGFGDMDDVEDEDPEGVWVVHSTRPDLNSEDLGVMDADIIGWTTVFDIDNPFTGSGLFASGLNYSVTPLITIGNVSTTYGQGIAPVVWVTVDGLAIDPADFGFSVGEGLVSTALPRSIDGFVNAGSYIGALTADWETMVTANHRGITTDNGNLTVGRAKVTVILDDDFRTYDGTAGYNGTVGYDGFLGTDDETLLTGTAEFAFAGGDASARNAGAYTVSASGVTESSGNYVFDFTDTATLTITQAVLDVFIYGDLDKVYDGTTLVTLAPGNFEITGFAEGEGASITQTVGNYFSADVPSENSIYADLSIDDFAPDNSDTLMANYQLPAGAYGYGEITPAVLTATIIGDPSKVYDGNASAALTDANFQLTGFVGEEGADVTQTQGAYASANASTTNAVTANLSIDFLQGHEGTDLNNYILPATAIGNGIITQKVLTAVIIGNPTKTYDGTTVATLTPDNFQLTGFVEGEGGTISETSGTYGSANASLSAAVSAALGADDLVGQDGTLASNYLLPAEATGFGTIGQAVLTAVIIGNPTKTYDGTIAAVLTAGDFEITGFVGDDGATITQTVGAYSYAGASSVNMIFAALSAGDFDLAGDTDLANYAVPSGAFGYGEITPAVLTATIIGDPSKVYDGNASAALTDANFQLTGFVGEEGADVTQTQGAYASANASTTNAVTANLSIDFLQGHEGTDLNNYILPATAIGNGIITQKVLTAVIIGNPTKTYDGTTVATLTPDNFQVTGFVEGEGGTISETSGTYGSANASPSAAVSAALGAGDLVGQDGTLASNYLLPAEATGFGMIAQAVLTAVIIGNPTKTYDGTIAAVLTSGNFQLTGFVGGEGANVTQTQGSYASPDASTTNLVTASLSAGDFAAAGDTLLANYVLPTSAAGNGMITRAALSISAVIAGDPSKVYDGSTFATLTSGNFILDGFLDGQGATVTQTEGTYASANASLTNLITAILAAGDFDADDGTNLDNYILPTQATGNGIITQAVLTAAIIGDPTKTYDGTTLATLTSGNFVLTGFVTGEGGSVTQTQGAYASANASTTNTVTAALAAGDLAANDGTLLANYILPTQATGNGIISQAMLTAAIIGDPTRVYDGTNLATLTAGNFVLTGFIAGEGADVTQTAGAYASPNASTTNAVTATLGAGDFAADGETLLANYVLPTTATGNGIITRATLTAAITGTPNRTYDGTTAAALTAGDFTLTGFVAGEGATVTQTAGTYATRNASTSNAVTASLGASDFAADGATLLSNYILPVTAFGNGVISQAVLTAAIIGNPTKVYDGTITAYLTAANFQLIGFVAGEGATVTQTQGSYVSPDAGTDNTVVTALSEGDFVADNGTLLSNYVLPGSASGPGAINATQPPMPPIITVRGIDAFDTTPLGQPTGPADGLQTISTETTKQIIDEINAGVAFCKQLVRQEYMVDCLSDRLQAVADSLSAVGEYSEVRHALEDASAQLHALALSNSGSGLPQAVHRAAGRSSSRPLTAVNAAAVASVNAQAAAIIANTELVLLRSSSSDRQRVAFEQISQVVDFDQGAAAVVVRRPDMDGAPPV